ncbi:hypothetical protein [Motilibacter aurantiacus]|uniref:hypothetical protein n=1 Tax=Motilibacter aurantiacus TaxID=2714955 RepID=UPI00140947B2|nr:hypothetical protein [Motilibacter aurantiacus]NHC45013.1 hypothetical protein [Motilibacter aurantiacus]
MSTDRPLTQHAHGVVRPEDGELLGRVEPVDGGWRPRAVFGGALAGALPSRGEAEAYVRAHGLAALAEQWEVRRPGTEWEACWLVEVRHDRVRVSWAPPKYLMPGQIEDVEVPPGEFRLLEH